MANIIYFWLEGFLLLPFSQPRLKKKYIGVTCPKEFIHLYPVCQASAEAELDTVAPSQTVRAMRIQV